MIGGLSLLDKWVLGSIWGISFLYGILTEQVTSKKVDIPCSITNDITEVFSIISILLAIVFPFIFGPFMVTLIHIIISVINVVMKNAPIAADLKKQELQNIFCVIFLTIIFLCTYISSMVICELLVPPTENMFLFVMIKYVIGTSHHLLGPICILASRSDILKSAVLVYKKGGTIQSKDFEITAEQIQKELGLVVNP